MRRLSCCIISALLLAIAMLVGCSGKSVSSQTSYSESADNAFGANSASSSPASEKIKYHGVTIMLPDGLASLEESEENDRRTYKLPRGAGNLTIRYYEDVGADHIDPGVFEERNGYVDGSKSLDSEVTIERMVIQGRKAIKWTVDSEGLPSLGFAIMIGDDQFTVNCMTTFLPCEPFDDLVSSVSVDESSETTINPEEWNKTTTVKGAALSEKEKQEAQEAAAKEAEEARKKATKPAGSYKVGSDIPAGEYKLTASGGNGYYCVYPDTSKGDILQNDNFSSVDYITVEDGQYIELSRCSMVEMAYAAATPGVTGNGMYKIGFDIPAGEYKLSSTGHGYYCIYDNSTVNRDILQNSNFDGSTYCVVSDGQYLVVNRAKIE